MKLRDIVRNREYRILALAAVFFGTGLYFWSNVRPSVPPASTMAKAGGALGAADAGLSPFSNMPATSTFRTFAFAGGLINGTSSLAVTAACADDYVAVLAFPASVDYRENVGRAVYNSAFPCAASGTVVTATITPAGLGNAPSGTYYYFTADQGNGSVWYNPK